MKYRLLIVAIVVVFGIVQLLNTSNVVVDRPAQNPSTLQHNWQNKQISAWDKLLLGSHKIFDGFNPKTIKLSTSHPQSDNHSLSSLVSVASYKKHNSSNIIGGIYEESSSNSRYRAESLGRHTYIYIGENSANDVIRCKLGQNSVSDCEVVLNNLLGPEHIVIVENKFYLININQPIMYACELLPNGEMKTCNKISLPISQPAYIVYNNYSLFISDLLFKKMVQCNLGYDFLVQSCGAASWVMPQNFFNTAIYSGYLYAIMYDAKFTLASVNKCVESSCSILHDVNLSDPTTIRILNNTAYVLDFSTNNLVSCGLNTNGDFSACQILKSGLRSPLGLAFYQPDNY